MEVLFICLVVLCIGLVFMAPKKSKKDMVKYVDKYGKVQYYKPPKEMTKAEKIDDLIERLEDIAMELEEFRER